MSNSINWGKIYESTWWGDQINTADSTYDYATDTFNAPFELEQRVVSENGFLESSFCMSLNISNLSQISVETSNIDSDAQAFITAAAITDPTQQLAIDNLVKGLKADSIWTKMKAIYPFVGGTASTHKWNLKDPRDLDAAFRLVFNGGWTHSSTGATPNGTNAYADTKLNPTTQLTNYNAHSSVYNRTVDGDNGWDIGLSNSIGGYVNEFLFTARQTQTISGFYDYNGVLNGSVHVASSTSIGFFNNSVISNTSQKIYKAGIQIAVNANTNTSTPPNGNVFISAVNDIGTSTAIGFNSRQKSFVSIGDGLTDTEAANLYTRVQAYQTELSRQV